VAEDGREFYYELSDTYQVGICSTFVIDTVLPLLEGGDKRILEAQLAIRFKAWIEALGAEEVVLISDCPAYDWRWVSELCQFYGTWPKNLIKRCSALSFEDDAQSERFNLANEFYWADYSIYKHHALVDARSLQVAWVESLR